MLDGPQILVFPAWGDNPFLNILALAARADGYRFLGTTRFDGLREQSDRLGHGDVLHLHWTSPIAQSAEVIDAAEAQDRVRQVAHLLDALRHRGVRIIWTIHNRLPHELRFREAEVELHHVLARAADRIHIMSPATPDILSEITALDPAKIVTIAHPSYAGIYDSGLPRASARASFDLTDEDHAILYLGQIRPYKGVDDLVRAVGRAAPELRASGRRPVLLLAGSATPEAEEQIRALLPDDVRAVTHFGFVPDGDIARWFGAADVAVFPYRAILNSGSVHLAATFGVPVILPDERHLRTQYGAQPWVTYFDTADPVASIAEALTDADRFVDVDARTFRTFTTPIGPWSVSRQYRALLRELVA